MSTTFKSISKALSEKFSIPITTLAKWASSDSRVGHRTILEHAYQAVSDFDEYSSLASSDESLEAIAKSLGFDAPLSMTIEGVSSRTFRSWFESESKRKLVIGFLIGLHWQKMAAASNQCGYESPGSLLNQLKVKDVAPGKFIRLFLISPGTLSKLVT